MVEWVKRESFLQKKKQAKQALNQALSLVSQASCGLRLPLPGQWSIQLAGLIITWFYDMGKFTNFVFAYSWGGRYL